MEEVLDLLSQPVDERAPVVALDERPVQLLASKRPGMPLAPGQCARQDYEYVRHGTANVFCIVEPNNGRHHTHVTCNRKAPQFAPALRRVARAYSAARTIHLVMDNLNTHRAKSLTGTFGEREGRRLWARFTRSLHSEAWQLAQSSGVGGKPVVTPMPRSHDRVSTLDELSRRTRAWNTHANRSHHRIDWRFTTADARRVFGYKRRVTLGSKH